MRQETTIEVKVLDFSGFKEHVMQQLGEDYSDVMDLIDNGPFGLIETEKGSYLIDKLGMGTGHVLNEEPAGILKMTPMFYNGGLSNDVVGHIALTKSVIEQIPIKETVTLDKFIVRYGAQVESNFEFWAKNLQPEIKHYDCVLIRSAKDLLRYGDYLTHEKCRCNKLTPLCEVETNLCKNFAARHLHCKTCGGV